MADVREPGLELISALAAIGEVAHTDAALGARLAAVFDDAVELVELELDADGVVRRWPGQARERRASRRIDLGDGRTLVLSLARDPAWSGPLERAITSVLRAIVSQTRTLARVAALSRRAHLDRELVREDLARAGHELVAASPAMRRLLLETVPAVAREDVTVLIRGETGTGKEVVARRIHALSRRARRPLLTINCAALPETLAESALFGHERGAFTGATARHAGIFERAHGATLFLDEIGELSPPMQARLLRVLSSGELQRVGGTDTIRADVRVLAATHRALEDMVARGTFREDLFYRLAIVPIDVPPLRERIEDVEPLARAALAACARRMGRAPPRISEADLARLRAWRWPGNVRELESAIERALVLTSGEDLALETWEPGPSAPRSGVASSEVLGWDDAQRRILREALDACEGRIYGPTGAAARLGLAPTTLQSKLEKLGLRSRR